MYSITLDNLGKKFNREWIFRNLNYQIQAKDKLVILGGNGSGKSTLLQVISSYVTPNEGKLRYIDASGKECDQEEIKNVIAFASPYIQLVEDFTAPELIEHIGIYKPFINSLSAVELLEITELSHAKHKFIRQYSSGMKQRLKLALAILADTPILLLDEPLSNLDKNAIAWYKTMMETYGKDKTVIVCSNAIADEYFFYTKEVNVMEYKTLKPVK
ncbi:MAG: ATP-binding cassette domain-containing protein [bacterium]|nr:ATP-binding cassette domain-containing protein [bacterium]